MARKDGRPVDGCTSGTIVEITTAIGPYDIDLTLPEADRWRDVISKERGAARDLALAAREDLPWTAKLLATPLGTLFRIAYTLSGGLYAREIRSWADAMGMSAGVATMLNCGYELSYLDSSYKFGCTAGVNRPTGQG